MATADAISAHSFISRDTMIARSPAALVTEFNGQFVLLSIERGEYYSLDDIAGDIWRRIETPCSFADLVDALAGDYDAAAELIAADVGHFLNRMTARGSVQLT